MYRVIKRLIKIMLDLKKFRSYYKIKAGKSKSRGQSLRDTPDREKINPFRQGFTSLSGLWFAVFS